MLSVHTVPLLFINLAGEMMYVLNHRLKSQGIPESKGTKVNNDILSIMLHEQFLNQLFKPQTIYNRHALRKLFGDLTHVSIMRLDPESMNKLYDLMIMAFKYQLLLARQPSELLLITLNHLDGIRNYVSRSDILKQIDTAYLKVMQVYQHLTPGELQNIRYSLLNILSGFHTKVSVFLRDNCQNLDGTFIIPINTCILKDCEIPGVIRVLRQNGETSMVKSFALEGTHETPFNPGSLELYEERGTTLGCNIYELHQNEEVVHPVQHTNNDELLPNPSPEGSTMILGENDSIHFGKEELNLLMSQLIRNSKDKFSGVIGKDMIQLNICSIHTVETITTKHCQLELHKALHIDARKQNSSALQKVIGEMAIEDQVFTHSMNNENKDLLDLFDGVSE